MQVALYWAVFSLGLKLQTGTDIPFGILLIAGILPWFVVSDALTSMTVSITGNAALVKRIVLPVGMLPVANLIAALLAHGVILTIAILLLWSAGFAPTARLLALPYYLASLAVLTLAAGTLLALANAAFRDTAQLLTPALMLWFWATPIVWPTAIVPPALKWILWINPVNHLVEGYRWVLLGPEAAAPSLAGAGCFWGITLALGMLGWAGFRTFKRELADLL
jgi:ABC-type polysaccharide/polyol phosphate export permease